VSNTPRTSFVIPARNAAATLAQTLQSVLAQSDGDWEALIVDNASTDTTAALIADHAQRDARLLALRGDGSGVAAARNVALQQARGRCVVFLDSDDWIAPTHLARLHAALDAAPDAAAAYCERHRVMPDGALAPAHGEPQIAHTPFDIFARSCPVAIHAVLVKRDAVARAGGFDPALRTCEDWDLWQRIAREGGRWVHVAEPLAFYRTSDGSLSQDMRRVLADAAVVIQRGFSADPRLRHAHAAHAAHAAGASRTEGATPERALAYFTLWCCAIDAVRGQDRADLRRGLEALPASGDHVKHIAMALVDAAMVGLLTVPRQLAARWAEHGPRITALIDALGAVWQDMAAARRVQYAFERLVLQYDDLATPRPLSLTLGLRVNLRALAPQTPPPGVDRFYVYLCDGDDVLAVAEAGALGPFTPRDWTEFAARRLGRDRIVALTRRHGARSITVRGLTDTARALGKALRRPTHTADTRIPVLAYQRVAAEAFDAQLSWLRANGYHAIVADELAQLLEGQLAPIGRPVMITFDHGEQDFADTAWPLLRQHGLRAEVLVATDFLGEHAASAHRPALMNAKTMAALAAEGARFGVCWPSHCDAEMLSTRALADALMQSRQRLAQWTARPPCALALPGASDQRLQSVAAACGYRIGLTTAAAAASFADDPMALPRLEVRDDLAPDAFVRLLEACQ
jgi:peptidoglycan/xylan/chitin deacetylase (PgdA/CDA1 family)